MAPELVSDPDRVSEKADIWSLGMVLWELLTLEVPFALLSPQQIIHGLMVGNLQPPVRAAPPFFSLRASASGPWLQCRSAHVPCCDRARRLH